MKFYYTDASPPCRTIVLLANLLNIEMEMIATSPKKGETSSDFYLQMNPQHIIPTLVDDDGYVVWESRIIAKYLVGKYAKNDDLYPAEFYTRLEIDKILDFDLGTVFRRTTDYFVTLIQNGKFDPAKRPKIDDAMKVFNEILKRNKTNFVVGRKLTIADISLITTVTSLEVVDYDFSEYPNVVSWLSNIKKAIPDYGTIGVRGEKALKDMAEGYRSK